MRRRLKVLGSLVVVVVVAVVAVYWFFLRTDAKPKAAIVRTAVSRSGPLDGTWTVFPGVGTDDATTSWVGYRVDEHLVTVTNTIVGRSKAVTGRIAVRGATVSSVSVTADASKLTTDRALRDTSVRDALETTKFPQATFSSSAPIELSTAPKAGELVPAQATGDLTLHGVTHRVTVPLQARWDGRRIQVIGELPIVVADYDISIPEIPGFVRADDRGALELQLFFEPER